MPAEEELLYGSICDGAMSFNHADAIAGAEDLAAITSVTVFTAELAQAEGPEQVIVDIAVEYRVGGALRTAGPFHPAASAALSSTFGLPGGSRITEVVGALSPLGLTFICFKTNKRTHMYGKAVPSARGGTSFAFVVPADRRLLGLRGQISSAASAAASEGAPAVAIQNVAPVFASLPYLDSAKVVSATMGSVSDDKAKDKGRRKLTRVSGRSANSSVVSSVGSRQSAGADKGESADPPTSRQQPGGKGSQKNGFVSVARTWKHPMGNVIEGEFMGDSVNGRATFTWNNGDRYVGQVQDGIAHGWGVFTVAKTGDTYNGSFEGGYMRGWGTMRFGNGDQYEGAFEKGIAHGQGHMISAKGDRYVGSYVDGHACGQGIKVWSDGRKYSGEWKKAREHGKGRMEWADGSWCEGSWTKGQMHGDGVMVNTLGDKYEGGWRWHKLHGAGTWTFASGVVYHGRWENGAIVKEGHLSHVPPTGTTLSQPALAKDAAPGASAHVDLEDLDSIIASGRRPSRRGLAHTTAGDVGPNAPVGGGLKTSPGTTAVAVPSATHMMPYGGPDARDLVGTGNEWDMQSVSSRASECDTTTESLAAAARDPASWHADGTQLAGGKGGFNEREVQMMAGMPEAMASGVGVPASALLQAALQRVLGAGTDAERVQAQNAIRVGLVQLDSDRRKRRLKSMQRPPAAGESQAQEPPSALKKVHMEVADLLQQHNKRMQAVRQKHAQAPARPVHAAEPLDQAGSGNATSKAVKDLLSKRVDASARFLEGRGLGDGAVGGGAGAGVAFNDGELVDFLTHNLSASAREAGGEEDGVNAGGEEEDANDGGGRQVLEKSKAALHSLVQELEERRKQDASFQGDDDEEELAQMMKLGIDIRAFQSSPTRKPADVFGNDVEYVAGMLRRAQGGLNSPRAGRLADDEEEEGLDERWKASIAASMEAAEKSKRQMEKRKSDLEAQRLAAVLQEAQAARARELEERRLRKELAVAAAEERTMREEEERRALMVQLEAELLVEMETQRRTTEEHRRAAKALQARRRHVTEQRRSIRGSTSAAAGSSEDAPQPAARLEERVLLERLREALSSDFTSFQRSFRMAVSEDGAAVTNAAVSGALRTAARVPSAPVVAILLEAVAAHNEGKMVLGRVLEALWRYGYTTEHFMAADVLRKTALRRVAIERRRLAQEQIAEVESEMLSMHSGSELERERERERERVRASRRAQGLPEDSLEVGDAEASFASEDASPSGRAGRKPIVPPRSELEEAEAAAAAILEILGETSDAEPRISMPPAAPWLPAATGVSGDYGDAAAVRIPDVEEDLDEQRHALHRFAQFRDIPGIERPHTAGTHAAALRLPTPSDGHDAEEDENAHHLSPVRAAEGEQERLQEIGQEIEEAMDGATLDTEGVDEGRTREEEKMIAEVERAAAQKVLWQEQQRAEDEEMVSLEREESRKEAGRAEEEQRLKEEKERAAAEEALLKREEEERTKREEKERAAAQERLREEERRVAEEADRVKREKEARAEEERVQQEQQRAEARRLRKEEENMRIEADRRAKEEMEEEERISTESARVAEETSEFEEVNDEGEEQVADEQSADVEEEAEEESADVEEEYRNELAATKIQAVARGRRQRRERQQALLEASAREEAREEAAVGEATMSPLLAAVDAPDTPAEEQAAGSVEETPEQARRRKIEARIARMPTAEEVPSPAREGPATPAPETPQTPQTEETASQKKPRKLLKPLPAVTAPHSDPAVASEILTELLGDPPGVWKIEWKDLEMKSRIGVGNFAQVYRGRLKREECAVKRFTHQTMSTKDFAAFATEASYLHRLRHPHICQLFGVCVEPGNLCIVTEFVPNGNLHTVLTRKRPGATIDWRTRVQMGLDLASAVAFLHSHKPAVLHLDIKSPNLLVDEDMRLKLADFGLARTKMPGDEVADKSTFQPGTVHWMAPELMTKGIKSEKTDVYAIGVVLWELWVMKTPYAGLKVNDIAIKVRGGARPVVPDNVEPTQIENELFKTLMEQCWHEDMTQRPSAALVQENLGAYVATLAPAKGYESD